MHGDSVVDAGRRVLRPGACKPEKGERQQDTQRGSEDSADESSRQESRHPTIVARSRYILHGGSPESRT
jgi:hypothetical protein